MPDVPNESGEILRSARERAAAKAAQLDDLRADLARTGGRALPPADVAEGLALLARAAAALRAVAAGAEPKDEDHA